MTIPVPGRLDRIRQVVGDKQIEGISAERLSGLLTGWQLPTSLEYALIADATGVTVLWLLNGRDEDNELAPREPDPDCERCDGSGLDPDAYFVDRVTQTWTHAPCSECLPEEDDSHEPTVERVKHSGPDTEFCVLCLSGEHDRVDDGEKADGR